MKTYAADSQLQLQPSHFIKICNGKIILWDYQQHSQFEISQAHLSRLIEFSQKSTPNTSPLDKEIIASGVLIDPPETDLWSWDWLAHIYHYGTCHPMPADCRNSEGSSLDYASSYAAFCESIAANAPNPEILKGGKIIELPTPVLQNLRDTSYLDVLTNRRTCRDFDGESVPLQSVSDLLFCAFGDQKFFPADKPSNVQDYGYRRTSPSAGGLQCTEPYLWAAKVDGLAPGIYHYLSVRHQLEIVQDKLPQTSLGSLLCHQDWANDLAFAIIMTVRFDKMWWKYPHSRAYRPLLMDVGHLSQTLCLGITAYGMHSWPTGYFHDAELAKILCCAPQVEHPMFLVGGGTGSGSSYDRDFRSLAKIVLAQ